MEAYPFYYTLAKTAAESTDASSNKPNKKRPPKEYGVIDTMLINMGLKEDMRKFKFKNTALLPTAIKKYRSTDSKAYDAEFARANPAKWYHHLEPLARGATIAGLAYGGFKARNALLARANTSKSLVPGLRGSLANIDPKMLANAAPVAGLASAAGVYQFARSRRSRIADAIKEDKLNQNKTALQDLMRNTAAMRTYQKDMDLLERVGNPRKGLEDPLTRSRHEGLLQDSNISNRYKRNVAFT